MTSLLHLLRSLRHYKFYVGAGVFFHLLTAVLTVLSIPLIIPFFQLLFGQVDQISRPPESMWDLEAWIHYGSSRLLDYTTTHQALLTVCGVVVVVFFFKNLSRFLISFFMVPARNGLLRDLRRRVWMTFAQLSLTDRQHLERGYLTSLITNDLSEVDHGILKVFELLFKTPLVIIGSLLFMLLISPRLTMIAFGLILFTLLVIGVVSAVLKRQSADAQEHLSKISVMVDQYLSSIRWIKSHGADGWFLRRFEKENDGYYATSNAMLRRRDLASPLAEFLGVVTLVALLYFGTQHVLSGEMMPSTFFAFIFAFYNIIDPAKSFAREYANVNRGMAALDRINGFFKQYADQENEHVKVQIKDVEFSDKLSLEDVSFRYTEEYHLLNQVNFELTKGKLVGLVGDSGAGKSTLIDMLLQFHLPGSGRIALDGRDVRDFDLANYRSLFGLCTQTPTLFFGTIAENICLDQSPDQERLEQCLSLVGLEPSLLTKRVGDQAAMVSGGEAQRIAMARLIYHETQIWLLDEPTAHLDARAQADMIRLIKQLAQGRTVLLISHRAQVMSEVDELWELEDGVMSRIRP